MFLSLAKAFFGALLGSVVDAVNAWRRDEALKKLGYTEAQRDAAVGAITAMREATAARDRVRTELERHPEQLRDDDGFRRD